VGGTAAARQRTWDDKIENCSGRCLLSGLSRGYTARTNGKPSRNKFLSLSVRTWRRRLIEAAQLRTRPAWFVHHHLWFIFSSSYLSIGLHRSPFNPFIFANCLLSVDPFITHLFTALTFCYEMLSVGFTADNVIETFKNISQANWSPTSRSFLCLYLALAHANTLLLYRIWGSPSGSYECCRLVCYLATCYTLIPCSADFRPWRWRWYVPTKGRFTHGLYMTLYLTGWQHSDFHRLQEANTDRGKLNWRFLLEFRVPSVVGNLLNSCVNISFSKWT
jgi:hypothetical protein